MFYCYLRLFSSANLHILGIALAKLADLPKSLLDEAELVAKKLQGLQERGNERSCHEKVRARRKMLLTVKIVLKYNLILRCPFPLSFATNYVRLFDMGDCRKKIYFHTFKTCNAPRWES